MSRLEKYPVDLEGAHYQVIITAMILPRLTETDKSAFHRARDIVSPNEIPSIEIVIVRASMNLCPFVAVI
jgi:hypothetical protein